MSSKIKTNSSKPPLLHLQAASVVKGGKRVLDGLSLEICEGEHAAILGPNGAGKTSFIRLITREDYPLAHDNGAPPLSIFGQELWNVFELRSHLGIISAELQAAFLNRTLPGRTRGLDAVLSGFFASYGVFPHHHVTEAMRVKARRALTLLEAEPLADVFIETMSTGEIRRILIARALITEPRALILDEPTTGLDLVARSRFLRTLQNLARHGKTIILVTHRVEEIFPEIDRVNPAAVRLFGWTREEVMGRRFPPASPDHQEEFATWLAGVMRGESLPELELQRKDGFLVSVSINAAPLDDGRGDAPGPGGIVMQLAVARPTEAESALAEQSWFLQHLIDTIPSPIFHKNLEGIYLGCNKALGDFLGLPKEEIIGKSVYDVYPKDLADKYHEMDSALFRQPGVQIYDAAMGHADGTRHDVTFFKATYSTLDGTLAGLVGVKVDISPRRRAEAALRESEQNLANIIDFLPDATMVIDREGRVIAWNKGIEDLTGVDARDMLGKGNYEYAVPFYGKRRPILIDLVLNPQADMAEYTEVKRDGLALSGVAYFPNLRGREAYLFGKASPLLDSQGNITGVIESIRDITERQRAEAERLKFSKLDSLGTLAGGIAHDFNNILTAIMGNIGLASLEGQSGGRGRERLAQAEQACLRAQGLAQQLLTFAKGGAPIKRLTSLAKIVRESVNLALAGSRVRYDFALDDDLWGVEVDEGQLHQAINNLLINADQAMAEGGTIKIRARNVLGQAGPDSPVPAGKYVQLTISDQGIGIPPKYLDKIFDPYFTTKQKGSGLGLATVYAIIKNHGGRLMVASEVGVGSTFSLYLPAHEAGVPAPEQKTAEPVMGRGRILVMDDEEVVREVLGKMLQRLGYEPHFAIDGSEAIGMFSRAKDSGAGFDLVILDLTIRGGMGGEKVLQELLKIEPQVRAIVSSGYCDDPIMAEFADTGSVALSPSRTGLQN